MTTYNIYTQSELFYHDSTPVYPNQSVCRLEGKVEQTYLLSNVKKDRTALSIGVLPPVVRSISPVFKNEYGDRFITVLVECKPRKQEIEYRKIYHRDEPHKKYDLTLPWHHFLMLFSIEKEGNPTIEKFRLAQTSLFFSKTKITGPEHQFYTPCLPNIFGEAFERYFDDVLNTDNVCMHETIYEESLIAAVNQTISKFWSSKFNDDAFPYYDKGYEEVSDCLDNLASLSLEDVISDAFFEDLDKIYSFLEYLTDVKSLKEESIFDIKKFIVELIASGEVIKKPSKRDAPKKISQYKIKFTPAPGTGFWRDADGRLRDSRGRFAREILQ